MNPYSFDPRNRRARLLEQARLGADLLVVTLYAYLLFTVDEFDTAPHSREVWRFLAGFPLVFLAYAFSGILRKQTHGRRASRLWPIVTFGSVYAAGSWAYYMYADDLERTNSRSTSRLVNGGAVLGTLVVMLAYRFVRWHLRNRSRSCKERGIVVGIDLDGVLGNQIVGVLPRIRASLGVTLTYDDITHWALPVGSSNIKDEIERAIVEDPDFVARMPQHPGARELLEALSVNHKVLILTSRPAETRDATSDWLDRHGLRCDALKSMIDMKKSAWATDVLVDDYIGNIVEYLQKTNGTAILMDQPWNRERDALRDWIDSDRLHVVSSLAEVAPLVRTLQIQRDERLRRVTDAMST